MNSGEELLERLKASQLYLDWAAACRRVDCGAVKSLGRQVSVRRESGSICTVRLWGDAVVAAAGFEVVLIAREPLLPLSRARVGQLVSEMASAFRSQ